LSACQTASANDTTRVKIFFGHNDHKIAANEQQILDEVIPTDSSIILKKILIYGYCDSSEKENNKHTLTFKRANEVKSYLMRKGMNPMLFVTIEGKGVKPAFMLDEPKEDRKQVLIMIEYEALIVDEPIIIKSSRKKQTDDQ
jgi:outer membrane protein OmpA-like peptidoglycan-associated protein